MTSSLTKRDEIFFQGDRLGASFCLYTKRFSSVKKCKFKKIILDYDAISTYDTHPEMVINHAKFDVCTPGSFKGVKAHIRTNRIALYTLGSYSMEFT